MLKLLTLPMLFFTLILSPFLLRLLLFYCGVGKRRGHWSLWRPCTYIIRVTSPTHHADRPAGRRRCFSFFGLRTSGLHVGYFFTVLCILFFLMPSFKMHGARDVDEGPASAMLPRWLMHWGRLTAYCIAAISQCQTDNKTSVLRSQHKGVEGYC